MEIKLVGNPSEYTMAELEGENYVAIGCWGCGNCGTGFCVPNDIEKQPQYCPFCGKAELIKR